MEPSHNAERLLSRLLGRGDGEDVVLADLDRDVLLGEPGELDLYDVGVFGLLDVGGDLGADLHVTEGRLVEEGVDEPVKVEEAGEHEHVLVLGTPQRVSARGPGLRLRLSGLWAGLFVGWRCGISALGQRGERANGWCKSGNHERTWDTNILNVFFWCKIKGNIFLLLCF